MVDVTPGTAADSTAAPSGPIGLKRVLNTRDLIVYGIMMMFPLAPIAVYLDVTGATGGHMAMAYVVAMVAMMFTALSYGAMAGAFPKAGSTYTFMHALGGPLLVDTGDAECDAYLSGHIRVVTGEVDRVVWRVIS